MVGQIQNIVASLIVNVLWLLIGILATITIRFVTKTRPARRLWQLKSPNDLIIVVATSVKTFTGAYYRRATGIGQLRALSLIVGSLRKAYKATSDRNIVMSDEELGERAENDLILLGGIKNNVYTKSIIERQSIVQLNIDGIIWKIEGEEKEYFPKMMNNQVVVDYGLIIKTENPYSHSTSKVIIIAGVHTQGVIAAARYFTENLYNRLKFHSCKPNIVTIIRCDVLNDHPVGIKVEKTFESKSKICT